MPVSRLVKYALASTTIFLGSTVAVQAQSDLPGCADEVVKEIVLDIVVENIEKEIRKNSELQVMMLELDWELDAFSLKYISLVHINEQTGALTCHATLHGRRDVRYFGTNPKLEETRARLEKQGYWDYQDITRMQYIIADSAEDPEYFIVSVRY